MNLSELKKGMLVSLGVMSEEKKAKKIESQKRGLSTSIGRTSETK